MIKKTIFGLLFLMCVSVYSQQRVIDTYKYVIVPSKFDFLKSEDQYQTSSLTKFLLEKKGFTVFLSNETLPSDLSKNKCLALIADVLNNSSMFSTKNIIQLKDCNNKVLYTSKEGKSKEKGYKKAYQEAIRKAYETMSDLKYAYKSSLVEEVSESALEKNIIPLKNSTPVVIAIPKASEVNSINESKVIYDVLYAQPIKNGFQVVNTKPEVVFQLLKTQTKDFFIIKNKNGIVYKNDKTWVAEFYEQGQLVVKRYQIKF